MSPSALAAVSDVLDRGPSFHGTKADLRVGRSREALRIVGEVADWTRQSPEALHAWRDRLAAIRADERGQIISRPANGADC